jgi:hypothetical protein
MHLISIERRVQIYPFKSRQLEENKQFAGLLMKPILAKYSRLEIPLNGEDNSYEVRLNSELRREYIHLVGRNRGRETRLFRNVCKHLRIYAVS